MPTSYSIGNHLHLLSLGTHAARSYAAELPKEAMQAVTRLEGMYDELQTLNARQEKAKQQLALLTRELKAKKQESMRERARLIRLAEATFGPRDPRIKEFRPATEGKVRTARGKDARRRIERSGSEPSKPLPITPLGLEPPRRAAPEAPSRLPAPLRSPSRGQEGSGQPERRLDGKPAERRTHEPAAARPAEVPPRGLHGGGSEAYGGLGPLASLRAETWGHPPLPLLLHDPAWRVGVIV